MDNQKENILRQCISHCIENNNVKTSTERVLEYIKDELEDQFNQVEQIILSNIMRKHQKLVDDEVERHLLGDSSNGELKGFFNISDELKDQKIPEGNITLTERVIKPLIKKIK
jgi:hypothetical protein